MEHSPESNPGPIRDRLKTLIPDTVWRRASELYWWWRNRGIHRTAAVFSTRLRSDRRRLVAYTVESAVLSSVMVPA